MKLLLHCCCGPCAAGSLPQFLEAGYEPFGWYWNPNIHPYQEHKARRLSFVELFESKGLPYEASTDYPLEEWLAAVAAAPESRCEHCYRTRLEAAACKARDMAYPCYSTTLLISPYQNHELLHRLGEEYGKKYGVDFAYLDLRPGFRSGQDTARQAGLYMQKYCGCIYSEKERYVKKKKKERKT